MTKPPSLALLAQGTAALALLLTSATAAAQATPLPESIPIGAWTFRPSLELRIRGEYRQRPFHQGGVIFSQGAILADAPGSNLPAPQNTTVQPAAIENAWGLTERARLGLAVDRGPVTASILLQDSRSVAASPGLAVFGEPLVPPGLGLFEAYFDVHTKTRSVWFRLGRQRLVWGDGRLLGESDWTLRPRALDGARLGFSTRKFDVDVFAVMVSFPGLGAIGGSTAPQGSASEAIVAETGSQLYGAHGVWHALPLLQVELAALARVARFPNTYDLTPSDTFVFDGRLSGDRRGFRYAVEGAYELGRILGGGNDGDDRALGAYAGSAWASWETALPGHLTFGARGSYASGDDGTGNRGQTLTRFDPILPEERPAHGRMGLYGWTNSIEAGGDIAARPNDALSFDVGYRFVGLAQPKGRWSTASLIPVGASAENTSHVLGHQIDASFRLSLWDPLHLEAGYGLFLTGESAKNILEASGRGRPDMQHFGYLQATLRAP